jgi:putative nucleotidyltransferase with HDIG domain
MKKENKQRIRVDQLQPGVFIHLDEKWFNHPFLFNKLKIENWNQIEILEKSGIREVSWVPEKSDCWPMEEESAVPEAPPPAAGEEVDPYVALMWRIKKEKIEHLRQLRENLNQCTRNYDRTIRNVPQLMQQMMTGSKEAVAEAEKAVATMVDTFLGDTDAIVHLINIREQEEGIYHHSLNVSVLAIMLGKKAKLTPAELRELGMGALFHDVGKNRIEKKILKKKGPLTRAETAVVQLHPQYGFEIMTKSGVRDEGVLRTVMEHHEQFNGLGYPVGLKGEKISILARILRIVDFYDNLCNNGDDDKRMTPYEALSHMYARLQKQIDVELFSLFVRSMGIYPPGTVVQLSNGEIGIIISINPDNPLKPSLLLYDPNIPKDEALICEMADHDEVAIEKSLRIEEVPEQVRRYLSATTHVTYFMEQGAGEGK